MLPEHYASRRMIMTYWKFVNHLRQSWQFWSCWTQAGRKRRNRFDAFSHNPKTQNETWPVNPIGPTYSNTSDRSDGRWGLRRKKRKSVLRARRVPSCKNRISASTVWFDRSSVSGEPTCLFRDLAVFLLVFLQNFNLRIESPFDLH